MISVVIITKNEEHNIGDCLESVRWSDERIVVDAMSHDRTAEIARRYTGRVLERGWPGFGAQKNFGIEQASSDWIMVLDADERVSPELAEEIRRRVETWSPGDPPAYQIPRRNFYYGRWMRWGGLYPDCQIRLFRKESARYNEVPIHENLVVQGRIGTLSGHLDHYTERRIQDHFAKFGLYTTLAARNKSAVTSRVRWHDLVFRPMVVWFKTYVLKQGFRDGIHGLIVSVFAAMYTYVKYVKLWDGIRRSHTSDPTAQ